jgi:hypothetical protein
VGGVGWVVGRGMGIGGVASGGGCRRRAALAFARGPAVFSLVLELMFASVEVGGVASVME